MKFSKDNWEQIAASKIKSKTCNTGEVGRHILMIHKWTINDLSYNKIITQ